MLLLLKKVLQLPQTAAAHGTVHTQPKLVPLIKYNLAKILKQLKVLFPNENKHGLPP
jgi:hypothetical protein